ncbi:MAG TPA: hypothetical protein VEF36_14610 [Roseiarcus sp.]|nr:hypothetical protein [Roseiarcus sp.]
MPFDDGESPLDRVIRGESDANGLIVPRRLRPQADFPLPEVVAAYDIKGVRLAVDSEDEIDAAFIADADAAPMILRTGELNPHRIVFAIDAGPLDLNLQDVAPVIDQEVIGRAVRKGARDDVAAPHEFGDRHHLRDVAAKSAVHG